MYSKKVFCRLLFNLQYPMVLVQLVEYKQRGLRPYLEQFGNHHRNISRRRNRLVYVPCSMVGVAKQIQQVL